MPLLQDWIHGLEEGRGTKVIKVLLAIVGFIAVAIAYDYFCFKNFYLPDAMDSAQLARNLSEGKGYTTDYVRPLSIHLIQEHREDRNALLKTAHPDLANAPVYPTLVAGLFKAAPVNYSINPNTTFNTYQPERWIAALNQFLFFCALLLIFFLARRLFNPIVAWISVIVVAGTELLWRYSVSGLSTHLLLVLVLGAVTCLVRLDEWQRENTLTSKRLLGFGILAGVLIGLAGLTRYSFLFLIFPAIIFVALFAPVYRIKSIFVILISFVIVVTPWLVRNKSVSGAWFGTAGFAVYEQTAAFPENTLQRSFKPDLDKVTIKSLASKTLVNLADIIQNQLPKLGGSWVTAFFLAGLLVSYRNPTAARLRIFIVAALSIFVIVQALGNTAADPSREISSDNLLVIFTPLILIFGVAFCQSLLGQSELSRQIPVGILSTIFVVIVSAPLVLAILPPRSYPFAYPPYHPPLIQEAGGWMKQNELMMSDVPWAVAWYGDRQCVALTLDREKEFFAINDDLKPVQALYLSPQTTDGHILSEVMQTKNWEQFSFQVMLRGEQALTGFPLKNVRREWMPKHVFLSDWERWKMAKE